MSKILRPLYFFGNSTARSVARAKARERKAARNARIDEMLTRGASYSVIAKAVGCTKQTVYNYVRRLKKVREVSGEVVELKAACRKALDFVRAQSSKKPPSNGSVSFEEMTTFLRIHRFVCFETSFAGERFAYKIKSPEDTSDGLGVVLCTTKVFLIQNGKSDKEKGDIVSVNSPG